MLGQFLSHVTGSAAVTVDSGPSLDLIGAVLFLGGAVLLLLAARVALGALAMALKAAASVGGVLLLIVVFATVSLAVFTRVLTS
jgi:hypothetical protein